MKKESELYSLLADLEAGVIENTGLYTVIHKFGNEGFIEAKPVVEKFLTNLDPDLRYIALNVLTFHWACSDHRCTCENFAINDCDGDNRRMGVAGLGSLLKGTRDPQALALLLRIFRNDKEECQVRDSAYHAILYILGRPLSEQPPASRMLDYTKDVNWDRIRDAEEIASRATS